ncbi:uncharacterized protein LOC142234511 [Haematobia irritans]|uniref:uncharacterized protein LOC142234511 n=1 Tax=Haematobia irritans TaxID=7368 RepID=UPI003F5087B0
MSTQLKVLIYLLLYGVSMVRAITIRDEIPSTTNSVPRESTTYRVTVANIKNSNQRVPEYLQRVRNGFAYDDADDVIHVIEPPKHFEQLKMLMQSRQKLSTPDIRLQQPINVKANKPLVKASLRKNPRQRTTKKPAEKDLDIQETEHLPVEHLPVEILASVRKTENYLRKFKPKIPLAPQHRVKTKKIQTVIWEKAHEHQQFVQGQEHKMHGIREFHDSKQRRKFIKKRIKRETSSTNQHPDLKGDDLLEHINELVKNATIYLENLKTYEDIHSGNVKDDEVQLNNSSSFSTSSNSRISVYSQPNPYMNEEYIVKILENSINATNMIMEKIKSKSNFTNIPSKCEYSPDEDVKESSRVHSLKEQIYCMQSLIKLMKAKKVQEVEQIPQHQYKLRPSGYRRYGERLTARKTKDLRHKPFLVATVEDEYFGDSTTSPLNASLIYDDVMTTIRNLLQANNLQNLEESTLPSPSPPSYEGSSETLSSWEEISIPQDNFQENVDFHNLNQYLNSLQNVVANLPHISNSSLNLHEIEGNPSKYYFINPLGGIYNLPQPFHAKGHRPPQPSSAIFRKFPDIPSISDYLGASGALLKATKNVIEIL